MAVLRVGRERKAHMGDGNFIRWDSDSGQKALIRSEPSTKAFGENSWRATHSLATANEWAKPISL